MNQPNQNRRAVSNTLMKVFKSKANVFFAIMIVSFLAFEIFNFSTTQYAFNSVLSNRNWSIVLSIAFCGIDFAGIARLFTPEQGADEPAEIWYLFGAWLLASAMNAGLTWWGCAVSIQDAVLPAFAGDSAKTVIPIFVAILVWIIRILLIGTFASKGDALLNAPRAERVAPVQQTQRPVRPAQTTFTPQHRPVFSQSPAPTTGARQKQGTYKPQYQHLFKDDEQ